MIDIPFGRSALSIIKEQLTEFAVERIKQDSLDRLARGVGAVLAPVAGYTGVKPVGRFVAGAGKFGGVNEGLQEHEALVVKGLPIVRQPADIGGHLVEVDKPVLVIPADEAVVGSDSPGGGPLSQGGHRERQGI